MFGPSAGNTTGPDCGVCVTMDNCVLDRGTRWHSENAVVQQFPPDRGRVNRHNSCWVLVMGRLTIICVATIVAATYFKPTDALACTCIGQAVISNSVPADGEVDVPTNIVPWVHVSGDLELFDADDKRVPHTVTGDFEPTTGCSQYSELVPEFELLPNTTYTLRATSDFREESEDSISFTTGGGAIALAPPAPPTLNAAFFDARNYLNSCIGDEFQGCAAGAYEGLVEVIVTADGETIRQYVQAVASELPLYLRSEGEEVCAELRARDTLGQRSEARIFCSKTDVLHVMPANGGDGDVECSVDLIESLRAVEKNDPDGEPRDEEGVDRSGGVEDLEHQGEGGCSLSDGPIRGGFSLWLLAGFAGAFRVRRRSSSRV